MIMIETQNSKWSQFLNALMQNILSHFTIKLQNKKKTKSEYISAKALQFPVVVNNATTGYKLQGSSEDALFISEWNNRAKNWIYVMLSCVCTHDGLFLKTKIPTDPAFYAMEPELASMLANFNNTVCCTDFCLDDLPQRELVTPRNP